MDPLTHVLMGGLAAKTLKVSPRRFWIMSLLGMAPDIDVLANGLGSWAFAIQHRGITHSFIGLIIQTFFYATVLGRYDKGIFRTRAWHYFFPLFFHLTCDFLTEYG